METPTSLLLLLLQLSTSITTIAAAAAAAAATASRGPLVASKCCPLGEQLTLSPTLTLVCAPQESDSSSTDGENVDEESVSTILERHPAGFPSWLDPNMTLFDANTSQVHEGNFLTGQPDGAYVRYGPQAPCPDEDQQMIPTTSPSRYRLWTNGSLELPLSAWGGSGRTQLRAEDFCFDRVDRAPHAPNGMFMLLACPCKRVLCVRKCCPAKTLYTEREGGVVECVRPTPQEEASHPKSALRWRPDFRTPDDQRAPTQAPPFHLMTRPPLCAPDEDLLVLNNIQKRPPYRRLWVYPNGSALMEHIGWGVPVAAGRWCGERLLLGDGTALQDAVFCLAGDPPPPPTLGVIALGATFVVGAFFLLLTLLVYAVLPELRAPPHARALMCHCGALLAGSVVLAGMQFTPVMPVALCELGPMIIQFSFLAAFFWLNVLCFDISWAFSGLRGLLGSLLDTSRRKFLYYSLYAWGSPLVITAVTVALHISYNQKALPQWVIVPNIGSKNCWFYGEAAHWAFFYGPMAVLLAANLALFLFTAARLAAAQKDAAQLNRGDSVRHDRSSRLSGDKRRFILYTKLFLLMGVTWVLEVVSWSVRQDKNSSDVELAWFFTDIINALRGVFIFIIFCCKRKVVHMLRKRLDAWGLPGGLPAGGSSSRSATYRSQTSTRQSSLLQLSPLGELGIYSISEGDSGTKSPRRNSPAQMLVNGTVKAIVDPYDKSARRVSLPLNGDADSGTKPPRRLSPALISPNDNGNDLKKIPHQTSRSSLQVDAVDPGTKSIRRLSPVSVPPNVNRDDLEKIPDQPRRLSSQVDPNGSSEIDAATKSPRIDVSPASRSPNINGYDGIAKPIRRESFPTEANEDGSDANSPRRLSPASRSPNVNREAIEGILKQPRRVSLQSDANGDSEVSSGTKSPRHLSPASRSPNLSGDESAPKQSRRVSFSSETNEDASGANSPRRLSPASRSPNVNRDSIEGILKQPRRVSSQSDANGETGVDSGTQSPHRVSPAAGSSKLNGDALVETLLSHLHRTVLPTDGSGDASGSTSPRRVSPASRSPNLNDDAHIERTSREKNLVSLLPEANVNASGTKRSRRNSPVSVPSSIREDVEEVSRVSPPLIEDSRAKPELCFPNTSNSNAPILSVASGIAVDDTKKMHSNDNGDVTSVD